MYWSQSTEAVVVSYTRHWCTDENILMKWKGIFTLAATRSLTFDYCFKYWSGHLSSRARLWTLHVRNRIRTLSTVMSRDQYAVRRRWRGGDEGGADGRWTSGCRATSQSVTRRPCPPGRPSPARVVLQLFMLAPFAYLRPSRRSEMRIWRRHSALSPGSWLFL